MKISMNELRGAIRMIIKEEVTKILPSLIAEALAEKYLKKVMAEVAGAAIAPASRPRAGHISKGNPTNLRELMQGDNEEDWEEETPKAMANDHKGIYHQSPLVRGKQSQTEAIRRKQLADVYGEDPEQALQDPRVAQQEAQRRAIDRVSGGDPNLAMMFEGTRPALPEQAAGGSVQGETQALYGEEGVPLDMLGKLGVNFGNIKKNLDGETPSAAKEQIDEARLKQLEAQRKALDRRA
jgi:hypothetical protein